MIWLALKSEVVPKLEVNAIPTGSEIVTKQEVTAPLAGLTAKTEIEEPAPDASATNKRHLVTQPQATVASQPQSRLLQKRRHHFCDTTTTYYNLKSQCSPAPPPGHR